MEGKTMSGQWYPGADRSQSRSYGTMMPTIDKLLLHTTESTGWPSYPSFAPTLTYDPWRHSWRQHMPIRGSASTLGNAGSYRTNRANVVQVEIVGFADESQGARYGKFIADIDQQAIDDLGRFAAWLHQHYGMETDSKVGWKAYNNGRIPSSYGANNGIRLSVAAYDDYRGLLGHCHAPGNLHGDPGSLDVDAIVHAAGGSTPPTETVTGEEDDTMSRYAHWRGEEQRLAKAGDWQTLKIDDDADPGNPYDITEGPTELVSCVLRYVVDGITEADDIKFRMYTVDRYSGKGENERQNIGPEVKLEGPRRGWLRDQRNFTWNVGGGPSGSEGRALRFDWTCTNPDVIVKEIEVSGSEQRED